MPSMKRITSASPRSILRRTATRHGTNAMVEQGSCTTRTLVIGSIFVCLASAAWAQTPSCKAQAAEKKLAGAALTSFTKKCERDAATACDASAKDKKLAGAAKTSFTKKCVSNAVGI